ncbi:uncharacterized protein LOC110060978 [Orbicella faveolata]|uniref:uncharacterized protein LOC110060978 n=1 Tax=Orbicella faveolata TaxID=48498 RepID=UPI0009E4C01D|nr:uncharacterized protein LOC110060978 [Orbicella faveolata]
MKTDFFYMRVLRRRRICDLLQFIFTWAIHEAFLFIYLFIHLFIYLFIYLFILSGPLHRKEFTFQGEEIPLTISYGHRVSHHASAELTRILIEEGLGYDNVRLVPCSHDPLSSYGDVTMGCGNDRTPGVPQVMIDTEVWVPFDREEPVKSQKMVDVGSLGITGRQGWYTTADFADRVWTVHHQPADHWRALQLPVVLQQLSLASKLVTCQACIEHEFNPPQCSQQNHTGARCVALLAGHKDNASEVLVEGQITSLHLNVSMTWLGKSLDAKVLENEAKGKPLLFYAWDPDPLTTSDKFRRITFPDCSFPWNDMMKNLTSETCRGCDFPMYDLRKFVWKEIQNRYKDIYGLVRAITLTREHIADILQQINITRNNTSINDSVCHWLNKSRDVWLPWIQAETSVKRTVLIGGMFPSLVEPKAIWSSPGVEVGAQLAVKEINKDINILNRCRLELLVAPTQCRRELVIPAYVRYLNRDESQKVIGIVGPACSKATLPIAEVSRFHNTILMGYGADDVSLSDRTRFPLFFRTNPSIDEFKLAYLSVFRAFKWKHCAILREAKYPVNTVRSRTEFLTKHGIQVLSREMPSDGDLDAKTNWRIFRCSVRLWFTRSLQQIRSELELRMQCIFRQLRVDRRTYSTSTANHNTDLHEPCQLLHGRFRYPSSLSYSEDIFPDDYATTTVSWPE